MKMKVCPSKAKHLFKEEQKSFHMVFPKEEM